MSVETTSVSRKDTTPTVPNDPAKCRIYFDVQIWVDAIIEILKVRLSNPNNQNVSFADVLSSPNLPTELNDLAEALECKTVVLTAATVEVCRQVTTGAAMRAGILSGGPTKNHLSGMVDGVLESITKELGGAYLKPLTREVVAEKVPATWKLLKERCPEYLEPELPGGVDWEDDCYEVAGYNMLRQFLARANTDIIYCSRDTALAWAMPHSNTVDGTYLRAVQYVARLAKDTRPPSPYFTYPVPEDVGEQLRDRDRGLRSDPLIRLSPTKQNMLRDYKKLSTGF